MHTGSSFRKGSELDGRPSGAGNNWFKFKGSFRHGAGASDELPWTSSLSRSMSVGASVFSLSRLGTWRRGGAGDEEQDGLLKGVRSDGASTSGRSARWCPEEASSWWGHVFYTYASSLIARGYRQPLEHDDLWDVAQRDEAARVSQRFQAALEDTAVRGSAPRGSVLKALAKVHGRTMFWTGVLKVVHDIFMFAAPFFLERLLHHMAVGGSRGGSLGWALCIFFVSLMENITQNFYFHALYRLSLHIKVELVDMLYAKSLAITSGVRSDMGVGAIANLQSNDAAKLWSMPLFIHIIWNGPFQILCVMGLLVRIMHWLPSLAGLGVTMLLIPTSLFFGRKLGASRRAQIKHTDARVKLCSEVITGIKAIKLYAWEAPYVERINALREKELQQIRLTQILSMFNSTLFLSGPVLVGLAAFGTFTALGYTLTASVAFPALALFNLLRFPIIMLPSQITSLIQARVGLQRIQKFMNAQEMEPNANEAFSREDDEGDALYSVYFENSDQPRAPKPPQLPPNLALSIRGGSFKWETSAAKAKAAAAAAGKVVAAAASGAVSKTPFGRSPSLAANRSVPLEVTRSSSLLRFTRSGSMKPELASANSVGGSGVLASGGDEGDAGAAAEEFKTILNEIDLQIPKGQLVVVMGQVGCGKSSLLHALLGEMHRVSGVVQLAGRVAYTSQDPWIQNATLRANVLMGAPYDESRYVETITACALVPDLEMLPAGDASEIGEKGINLSGGQKHRVALARAVYADADIYLLDDPLSAVDAHVGRHLFDRCICGILAGSTRVLVTHQLQFLPSADMVVVMDAGKIEHVGTYQELIDRGVDFHKLVKDDEDAAGAGDKDTAKDDQPKALEQASGISGGSNTKKVPQPSSASLPTVFGGAVTFGDDDDDDGNKEGKDKSNDGSSNKEGDAGDDAVEDKKLELMPLVVTKASDGGSDSSSVGNGGGAKANGHNHHANGHHHVNGSVPTANGVSKDKGGDSKGGAVASSAVGTPRTPGGGAVVKASEEEKAKLLQSIEKKEKDGQLVKAEERAKGRVKKSVYAAYLSAWSVAFVLPVAMIFFAFGERGLQVLQNFTLSNWSNATDDAEHHAKTAHNKSFMLLYMALGFASIALQLIRSGSLIAGSIRASRTLQQRLLDKVVRLPMSFFDSQPTGRLLNRFTKDTEAVDTNVSSAISSALTTFTTATLSIVVVAIVTPAALIVLFPLSFIYYRVQQLYVASSRELKRLDSVAASPIFQHFGETLTGLTTIRAFRRQAMFLAKNRFNLNHSNRAYWPIQVVNRWLSVRLELMGASIVFASAITVSVIFPRNAGLAGLALTSALNLTGILNWLVRQATDLEVNMNSVERLVEYDKHPEEAPAVIAEATPPPSWPSRGAIEVKDLYVKYRPELDPVLRGLTFNVRSAEKIGVCGRTGCGKSTLMITLYRLVEPHSGTIAIDGIDISTIGLTDLRSRLSLVPQDPVIFSGTIRSNLDPFGQMEGNDAAIMQALRQAGIEDLVKGEVLGLDSPIKEGGANLSVGQRQLLCMARALLRASKILVLDEATSNVDHSTDSLIQRTIRTAFKDCTVLTIAHRLHTIIDSDRILLLGAGQLVEYDTPKQLLRNPEGEFRQLVEETCRGGGLNADLVAGALREAVEEEEQQAAAAAAAGR